MKAIVLSMSSISPWRQLCPSIFEIDAVQRSDVEDSLVRIIRGLEELTDIPSAKCKGRRNLKEQEDGDYDY